MLQEDTLKDRVIVTAQVATKTQRIDLPAIALAQASFRIPELGSRRV